MKKIRIFEIPVADIGSQYPRILCKILKTAGYDCEVVSTPEQCVDADLAMLLLYARFASNTKRNDFMRVKDFAKKVAYINTEQIHRNPAYLVGFNMVSDFSDFVFECSPEMLEYTKNVSKLPVFDFSYGYDEGMTLCDVAADRIEMEWDLFMVEGRYAGRIPFYGKIDEMGMKCFAGLPITDMKKIAYFAYNSKICFTAHHYGKDAIMSTARVVGMFMANKGFVLCQRVNRYDNLVDGEHIVYFDGVDDMKEKIEYYMNNQGKARQIAESGFDHIKRNMRMDNIVLKAVQEVLL